MFGADAESDLNVEIAEVQRPERRGELAQRLGQELFVEFISGCTGSVHRATPVCGNRLKLCGRIARPPH